MLIRVIIKNLLSFREETEFNMLKGGPRKLNHHVYKVKRLELLKATAIYGANGAGKSNLVKAISLLRKIVISEHIPNNIDDFKFKLNKTGKEDPMYLAIEFIFNDYLYFYEVSINKGKIIEEKLSKSLNNPEKYEILFSRGNQGDKIKFNDEFEKNEENKILKNVIEKSLLRPDQSLIFLLNRIGESQFKEFKSIFDWFISSLEIIYPESHPTFLPYLIEKDTNFRDFSNLNILAFKTGINTVKAQKIELEKFFGEDNKSEGIQIRNDLINDPDKFIARVVNNESIVFYPEGKTIYALNLIFEHIDNEGKSIYFTYQEESDGTKRLLDYMPVFLEVILKDKIYVIDEIERSVHPLLIKELLNKFLSDKETKGQIVFTTHESSLLDQNILRRDEIWFAEKNKQDSTELYPLSEFKVHNTTDIRKGYLNGRYGAIPFLGNLKDLNWKIK